MRDVSHKYDNASVSGSMYPWYDLIAGTTMPKR